MPTPERLRGAGQAHVVAGQGRAVGAGLRDPGPQHPGAPVLAQHRDGPGRAVRALDQLLQPGPQRPVAVLRAAPAGNGGSAVT
ncbi:hypothetical protein BG452_38875 [Streptomyces sp. CBMA123]|nr:hypothetical protein [Streptomyces sp. CBMA123]